jgi:protein N-terminal amidase
VLSMAWLTRLEPSVLRASPEEPDLETLFYWIERFTPLLRKARESGQDVVLVLANRCGLEPGTVAGVSQGLGEDGDDVVSYAGSSSVVRVKGGDVQIFDLLGKAEERLLVVDTEQVSARVHRAVLVYQF